MAKKIKNSITAKKSSKVAEPLEHDPYFVYLKNPLEYRRQILESSRKIIFSLKNHQRILLIRQKKLKEISHLKSLIKELLYLNRKFNDKLPKYDSSFLEGIKSKDKKSVKPSLASVPKPVQVKAEKTDLDRLEESLAGIEKKLRNLQ